jgi:hypothetical protein
MGKVETTVARRRSRKVKKEDSWLDRNWWVVAVLLFFLLPSVVFPPFAFGILFFLIFMGLIAGMFRLLLGFLYIAARAEGLYDKDNTAPALSYSGNYGRHPRRRERAVLEDIKIMIRKVDRRRGIKKEAYMRKRRIEVTREVNDLDLLLEPEEGKEADFSDL